MKRLFAAIGAAVLMAAPVDPVVAGPNQPVFTLAAGVSESSFVIAQQSGPDSTDCAQQYPLTGCVYLPPTLGDCLWDVDSRVGIGGNGLHAPGTQVVRQCVISDWAQRIMVAYVRARSPDLIVTVGYSEGRAWSLAPVLSRDEGGTARDEWSYVACIIGPTYYQQHPGLSPVADSNGGIGSIGWFEVTITNPTGTSLKETSSSFVIGSSEPLRQQSCREPIVTVGGGSEPVWSVRGPWTQT